MTDSAEHSYLYYLFIFQSCYLISVLVVLENHRPNYNTTIDTSVVPLQFSGYNLTIWSLIQNLCSQNSAECLA